MVSPVTERKYRSADVKTEIPPFSDCRSTHSVKRMGLEGEEVDAFEQVANRHDLMKQNYQLTLTGGQCQGQGGRKALQGVRHREDSGCQRYIFSFSNIFNDSL